MSTGNSLNVKTMQVPLIGGTPKHFSLFWTKFKSFAGMKGFQKALKESVEADLTTSKEVEVEEGSNADKAHNRNLDAMTYLMMAFTTESNMTMIMRAQTDDWPSGLAWKVVKELLEKYKPNDNMARVEARMMLNNVSMKNDNDLSVLFEQISQIQNHFGSVARTIEDGDLIVTALAATPSEYHSVLTTEQRIRGADLTLNHLEDAMRQLSRQTNLERGKGNEKSESDNNDEVTLGEFDGFCYLCLKKGHKAHFCPTKNNAENGENKGKMYRFTGACFNCGKQGHRLHDCWEKEENKHKRPSNFKTRANSKNSEQGNVTVDKNSGGFELLLTCLDLSREAFDDCLVDCNVVLCDNDKERPWDVCFDNGDDVVDCLCANEKVMNGTKICNENFCEKEDQLIFLHDNPEVCDDHVRGEMNLALSFPRCTMLLSDHNVWLADTAATVHTTPHLYWVVCYKRSHSG